MKRLSLLGFVGVLAGVLAGCPIYDNSEPVAAAGTGGGTSGCYGTGCTTQCTQPSDCAGPNQTCGADGQCHTGDCTIWNCPSGYACTVQSDATAVCEPSASGSGGSGGGSNVIYCGNPKDCAAGTTCGPDGTCQPGDCSTVSCIYGYHCDTTQMPAACVPNNAAACGSDSDCTAFGTGYACVSGICTAPPDQCTDQTQCGANDKCVAGKCTPGCTSSNDCSPSYQCDATLGVCSTPTKSCTITNDCGSAQLVCVDGACVSRSTMGSCPTGDVWVENGCIPNQSADFTCMVDGQQDACAAGSICLHHSCYISCDAPNQTACQNLPSFNVCKSVTTSSGTYNVCGSNNNLGNQCDPTAGLQCPTGEVCIDGFCK